MKIEMLTDVLSREHEIARTHLATVADALGRGKTKGIPELLRFLDEDMPLHRRKEEEALFPALARDPSVAGGPIRCMLADHEREKHLVESLRQAVESSDLKAVLDRGVALVELLTAHIQKEENVLFPYADQALKGLERAQVRSAFEAIGTFCPPTVEKAL